MAVISTEQRHSLVYVEVCWDPPSESEGRVTAICDHYRHSMQCYNVAALSGSPERATQCPCSEQKRKLVK